VLWLLPQPLTAGVRLQGQAGQDFLGTACGGLSLASP
jgi:hypothetical protein